MFVVKSKKQEGYQLKRFVKGRPLKTIYSTEERAKIEITMRTYFDNLLMNCMPINLFNPNFDNKKIYFSRYDMKGW